MLNKLWKLILVLAIVMFVVFFPAIVSTIGSWLVSAGWLTSAATVAGLATSPWWVAAAIGVGLAYLIDPETMTDVVKDVGELAETAAETVVDVVGGVTGSLLSSPIVLGIAAFLAYLFFTQDKKTSAANPEVAS